jgi:serine protease Do
MTFMRKLGFHSSYSSATYCVDNRVNSRVDRKLRRHLENALLLLWCALLFCVIPTRCVYAETAQTVTQTTVTQTIATAKTSIVGIGTFKKTRSPAINFTGTGFAIEDGLTIVTNAHVIPEILDTENNETLGIVTPNGSEVDFRVATVVAKNVEHDLAILSISGPPLPAMKLADSSLAKEGQSLLLTGFPLGMVLGLHHATHRAMISAVTPVVLPAINSRALDARMVAQLRRSPFVIFQLDGTAYPGNSGSPLYDPESGEVYGVINMGVVKGLKESAITQPSGISYAIPSNFIGELLRQRTK